MANRFCLLLQKKLSLVIAAFFIIVPCYFFAEEHSFSQTVRWQEDKNSFGYRLELEEPSGKIREFETEETFVTFSLPAGKYRYRIFAYDFLGREASVTDWTELNIVKAIKPEIIQTEENIPTPSVTKDGDLALSLTMKGVSEESKITLVNTKTGEKIPGTLKKSASGTEQPTATQTDSGGTATSAASAAQMAADSVIDFSKVKPGSYTVEIQNPGGLKTTSKEITVANAPAPEKITKEEKRARGKKDGAEAESQDALAKEEPASANAELSSLNDADSPDQSEKHGTEFKTLADGSLVMVSSDEDFSKSEEEVDELPEEEKPKKEKKPRKIYVCKDVNFEVGTGFLFNPYDGTLDEYSSERQNLGFNARFSWYPVKKGKRRMGAELSVKYDTMKTENDFLDSELTLVTGAANFVWQHQILTSRVYGSVKGGAGVFILDKNVKYLEDLETRSSDNNGRFGYPLFQTGLSVFFHSAKYMVIEMGVDFSHALVPDMPTGFINPYLCAGLRL